MVYVSSVYVHSAIYDTYLVEWYFIDILSIGMEGICNLSICVFYYM